MIRSNVVYFIKKSSWEKNHVALTSENEAGDDFGVDVLPPSVVSTVSSPIGNLSVTFDMLLARRMSHKSSAVLSCPRVRCWRFWRVICSRHRFVCAFTRSRAHTFLLRVPCVSDELDSRLVEAQLVLVYVHRVVSVAFDLGEKACDRDKLLFRWWPNVEIKTQIVVHDATKLCSAVMTSSQKATPDNKTSTNTTVFLANCFCTKYQVILQQKQNT